MKSDSQNRDVHLALALRDAQPGARGMVTKIHDLPGGDQWSERLFPCLTVSLGQSTVAFGELFAPRVCSVSLVCGFPLLNSLWVEPLLRSVQSTVFFGGQLPLGNRFPESSQVSWVNCCLFRTIFPSIWQFSPWSPAFAWLTAKCGVPFADPLDAERTEGGAFAICRRAKKGLST